MVLFTKIMNGNSIPTVAGALAEVAMREAWRKRYNYISIRRAKAPVTREISQRNAIAPRNATKYDNQMVSCLNRMS